MSTLTTRLESLQHFLHSCSRSRAFLCHLAASATIVGCVCAAIFLIWYPDVYFHAKGAWSVLRVLVSVDLVLGPMLTLVLFKPGKPGLLFDLAVVVVIQLSALVYGTTVIYQERPYFAVFAVDRFQVLPRKDVDFSLVDFGTLGEKPLVGPLLVAAVRPTDPTEFQRLLEEVVFEQKPDLERRPEYWEAYDEHRDDVLERARPLSDLARERPDARGRIEAVLSQHTDSVYVPLAGRETDFAFIIDSETAMPIDLINVDPWLPHDGRLSRSSPSP